MTLSLCEANYISNSKGSCQSLWLNTCLKKQEIRIKEMILLMVNNKSTNIVKIQMVEINVLRHEPN